MTSAQRSPQARTGSGLEDGEIHPAEDAFAVFRTALKERHVRFNDHHEHLRVRNQELQIEKDDLARQLNELSHIIEDRDRLDIKNTWLRRQLAKVKEAVELKMPESAQSTNTERRYQDLPQLRPNHASFRAPIASMSTSGPGSLAASPNSVSPRGEGAIGPMQPAQVRHTPSGNRRWDLKPAQSRVPLPKRPTPSSSPQKVNEDSPLSAKRRRQNTGRGDW